MLQVQLLVRFDLGAEQLILIPCTCLLTFLGRGCLVGNVSSLLGIIDTTASVDIIETTRHAHSFRCHLVGFVLDALRY